jgi:hypothetical protein
VEGSGGRSRALCHWVRAERSGSRRGVESVELGSGPEPEYFWSPTLPSVREPPATFES